MKFDIKEYNDHTAHIDWSKQTQRMVDGHFLVTEAGDLYGEDATIDKAIDKHIAELKAANLWDCESCRQKREAKTEPKAAKEKKADPAPEPLKPLHEDGNVFVYPYKDGKFAVTGAGAKAAGGRLVAAGAKYNPNAKIADHKGAYIITATMFEIIEILNAEDKPKPATMPKADPKPGTYHERVAPILAALENEDEDMPKKKVLEYAARVQEVRKDTVVINDNAKQAMKVLEPTYLNLLRWITAPGRYDIQGVDIAADKAVTVVARVNKVGIFNRFRR